MMSTLRSGHGCALPGVDSARLRGDGRRATSVTRCGGGWADRRASSAICLVFLVAALCLSLPGAARAASRWSSVAAPFGTSSPVNDVCAFGTLGLAAVGDDGRIGVTRNAGRSWSVVVPDGLGSAVLTAVALDASGRGIVASGGLLLVRDAWGEAWHVPVYEGPGPRSAINDVALRGTVAVAVGDDGSILTSEDAGARWTTPASPTTSDLTCVAIAGDGTVVAGSKAGELLVAPGGVWTLGGALPGGVTSVAASLQPAWGDDRPDLFATDGNDVVGSDDGLAFASLPDLPDLSSQSWPSLVCPGVPECALVLAGAPDAGCFEPLTQSWLSDTIGLTGVANAVAPGGQSVAYVLGTDGRLVRTLSDGLEPAALAAARTSIVVGGAVRLTADVSIGAPGEVRLRQRVPGRSWSTMRKFAWTPADWGRSVSVSVEPKLTHEYRLEFSYGGTTTILTSPVKVTVKPRVTTTKSTIRLRVGQVYRVSGAVTPTLRGETVYLYTDRGGSWRRVSAQSAIKLKDGRTWVSRAFGTPRAETYHLRTYLPTRRTHGAAWSRVVTVAIR